MGVAGSLVGGATSYFGGKSKARAQRKMAERQEKLDAASRARARELAQRGEQQLMGATEAAPQELQQVMADVRGAGTREQQEALQRAKMQLAQQGVRGGQAATLLGRQTGALTRDISADLARMAYEDALKRRSARLGLFGQKTQAGITGQI